MPDKGFQKVSVFVMDNWNEVSRLNHLRGVVVESRRNILL